MLSSEIADKQSFLSAPNANTLFRGPMAARNIPHSHPMTGKKRMHETDAAQAAAPQAGTEPTSPETLIEADDLVEEVSIDGMCGVY